MTLKEKTTYFIDCVYEYQKQYQLMDHEIHIFPHIYPIDREKRANWDIDVSGRIVSIYYSNWWIKEVENKEEIRRVAMHEILEIMLGEIMDSLLRYYSKKEVDRLIHKPVRILENVLLGNKLK